MLPGQANNPLLQSMIIPYILIFVIFYFLVFKPQKDKQKQHKEMIANLKKNDQVVTSGGIYGTVVNVKEKTVVVRIDDNAKMEVDREAISTVVKSNG